MRLRKGCLIRVLKESGDGSMENIVGSLGIYIRNDNDSLYPLDILIGVWGVRGYDKTPEYECCYQVERITKDEYIREYTLARLRGEPALSIEELKEALREHMS